MEKKLRVKLSTFVSPLSFNEWAEQYKVSSLYTQETPYFQGNLTHQEPNMKSSLYQSVEDMFPRKPLLKTIIDKFKTKKDAKRKQIN